MLDEAGAPSSGRRASRAARSVAAHLGLRTIVHRFVLRTLDARVRPPLPPAAVGVRTLRVGPEPLRVLLLGDSNAIGYGVRSREESIDRFLCDELAHRTGRGIVLENRGVPHVTVADSIESLGAAGTLTFHVAVWSPSFVEGVERVLSHGWRPRLRRMALQLRAETGIPVVLMHMPLPTGRHYSVPLLRWGWKRIDRAIDAVAAELDGVHAALVTEVPLANDGTPHVDPDTYRSTARMLAPVVLRAAGIADRTATGTDAALARR